MARSTSSVSYTHLDVYKRQEQASYYIENEAAFREYVLPAYEALRDFLVEHKGSGSNSAGLCYFPDGSDYYAALVYDATGSSHSIDELLEMTEKQRKSDLLAINGIAASHPGISLTTDDFPMKDATPEEMLTCLSSAITKDFLPPVSTDFSVRSVDSCMQDSMAPALSLIHIFQIIFIILSLHNRIADINIFKPDPADAVRVQLL